MSLMAGEPGAAEQRYDRQAAQRIVSQERRRGSLAELGGVILTVLIALAVALLVTLAIGKDPVEAFRALVTGPVSRSTRIGRLLEDWTTITLLGLSVVIPFRAGQLNVGAEGQLFTGALVAGTISVWWTMPPGLALVVPLVAAATAGFLVACIPGWMKAHLGANELVSTLMLNAIILRIYSYLLTDFLTPDGATNVGSAYLPSAARLPMLTDVLGVDLGRANAGILFVPFVTVIVWVLLRRTSIGFAARIIGGNKAFATYGGINVKRVIVLTYAIGGAVAGLAGAHLVQGVNGRLLVGISAGLGFEGIVVAILARNNPLVVPVAAFFYSYLRVGGDVMEQEAKVGTEIVYVIQAVVVLLITARMVQNFTDRRRARLLRIPVGVT